MSKIMELVDTHVQLSRHYNKPDAPEVKKARAALQAKVEMLEADVDAKADIAHRALDERDALREKLAQVEKDAARWRYTQKKGYFTCGPTDYEGDWMGYVVGVQRKGKSVNESVQGRGDTLVDAIDAAMEATK